MRWRWAWLLSARRSSAGASGNTVAKGPLNDLNDLGLTLGHVQRVGQPALEALPLHLGVADLGLLVGVGHGRTEFGVQALGVSHGAAELNVEIRGPFRLSAAGCARRRRPARRPAGT